jgi:hypothetical protein
MAARKMIAGAGSMVKVTGIIEATAKVGPSPGRAPIKIPYTVPSKRYKRQLGCKAIIKPLNHISMCIVYSSILLIYFLNHRPKTNPQESAHAIPTLYRQREGELKL